MPHLAEFAVYFASPSEDAWPLPGRERSGFYMRIVELAVAHIDTSGQVWHTQ
jgi:hypothetical protein